MEVKTMKLLHVKASHFKNCKDDFTIDFIAQSKKTTEDKEYELQEIADSLFVYNTAALSVRMLPVKLQLLSYWIAAIPS